MQAGSFPRGRLGAGSLATGVVALISVASSASSTPRGDEARGASGPAAIHPAAHGPMWIEMRNVDLHIDETRAIGIRSLRGEVVRSDGGVPAALDDSKSFTVRVTSGTVVLGGDALAALLNEVVFAYRGSPLKHLRATIGGSRIVLRGTMHKGVDLPFEIASTPTLEADGRVRLHPSRTRILGIDGAKLMRALGLHLDKLLDLRGAHGVAVAGDDLLLDPTSILPPPAINGRLASIAIEGLRVVMPDYRRVAADRGRVAARPLPRQGQSPARANLAVDSTRQPRAPGAAGASLHHAPAITRQVANGPAFTEIVHQGRHSVVSRREGQPAEGGVPRSRAHRQ